MRVVPLFAMVLAAMSLAGSGAVSARSSETPATSRFTEYLGGGHEWSGVLNYRTKRAHVFANYDATGNSDLGLIPGPVPAESIAAAGVSYLRMRACSEGPCWMRKDHRGVPLAANLDQWAGEDPFSLAELIRASAKSRRGAESVRGVDTTRYAGLIDTQTLVASVDKKNRDSTLEGYADLEQKSGGLASMSAAVWIDNQGLPRRIRIERSGNTTTWEYFDFGVPAEIALPAESDVMSSSDLQAFMEGVFKASR